MRERIQHIRRRRRALKSEIDAYANFEAWEETCVPSYTHSNRAAAWVSWWRLFAAVDLADAHAKWGRVLDFGASVGELGLILPSASTRYEFIEQDEAPAAHLLRTQPDAVRHTLESAPDGAYSVVFALDSLEHNTDYAELLQVLARKLAPEGILVLSGPTENRLYKLGRRIAGFDAHYHETNIYAIEAAAERTLDRIDRVTIPFGTPIFQISAWQTRRA